MTIEIFNIEKFLIYSISGHSLLTMCMQVSTSSEHNASEVQAVEPPPPPPPPPPPLPGMEESLVSSQCESTTIMLFCLSRQTLMIRILSLLVFCCIVPQKNFPIPNKKLKVFNWKRLPPQLVSVS